MGETRVDLLHLLEDLRDAYPGGLEETILTEVVANALDSGARRLSLIPDPAAATLTVVDDGAGMGRRELARYHDLAATTKVRGQGIGFAGVGMKLGLLASRDVLTETRRRKTHVATSWHLASRQRAPWRWVPPPGLLADHGTAIRLILQNPLSPLLDAGFVAASIERHFQPLLDPTFDGFLTDHYPAGVEFAVSGARLERGGPAPGRAPLAIRLGRKRKPAALGYLLRAAGPLPESERGLAISTLGKIIKRGWDWLGLSPAVPDQIAGLIEVPGLAGCLTLNKADFIRTGSRGAAYLAYRKAIQEAVSVQLAAWGDTRDRSEEARRRARPAERDIERVLVDLAEDFPLLAALVERRVGGQARLPTGRVGGEVRNLPELGDTQVLEAVTPPAAREAGECSEPGAPPREPSPPGESSVPPAPEVAMPADLPGGPVASGPRGPRRPGRYSLAIQFEHDPDDPGLGRLVESTVWVNEAHPAYRRAAASRSEGYHIALSVAMALAPLAVEPSHAQSFVTAFLARWGEALDRDGARRRPRRRPGR